MRALATARSGLSATTTESFGTTWSSIQRSVPTLAIAKKRLTNGQAEHFTGVAPRAERRGSRGCDSSASGRKWRTFKQLRTDSDGRFHGKYRFTQTLGSVRYVFRALVKRQAGYPYEPGHSRKRNAAGTRLSLGLWVDATRAGASHLHGAVSSVLSSFAGLCPSGIAHWPTRGRSGPLACSTYQPLLRGLETPDRSPARPPPPMRRSPRHGQGANALACPELEPIRIPARSRAVTLNGLIELLATLFFAALPPAIAVVPPATAMINARVAATFA